MKKKLLTIIFTMLFALVSLVVFEKPALALSLSANAGAYIPAGSYSNKFKTGYDYGLSVEQKVFLFTYAKLNYHHYYADGKNSNYSILNGDLNGDAIELMLKIVPFNFIVSPYASVGGGYYNNRIKSSINKYTMDGFGFVGEAGVNVNFLSILSLGVYAKYYAPHLKGNGFSQTAESWTAGLGVSVHIPLL